MVRIIALGLLLAGAAVAVGAAVAIAAPVDGGAPAEAFRAPASDCKAAQQEIERLRAENLILRATIRRRAVRK